MRVKPLRRVSLRFLVPELEELVGPHGLQVDWLSCCYRVDLDDGHGRKIPVEYFFTDCPDQIWNAYDESVCWDNILDIERCEPFECTDGHNPCPYDCRPLVPDATRWRDFLPPTWEYPELIASPDVVLAADNHHRNLWWH